MEWCADRRSCFWEPQSMVQPLTCGPLAAYLLSFSTGNPYYLGKMRSLWDAVDLSDTDNFRNIINLCWGEIFLFIMDVLMNCGIIKYFSPTECPIFLRSHGSPSSWRRSLSFVGPPTRSTGRASRRSPGTITSSPQSRWRDASARPSSSEFPLVSLYKTPIIKFALKRMSPSPATHQEDDDHVPTFSTASTGMPSSCSRECSLSTLHRLPSILSTILLFSMAIFKNHSCSLPSTGLQWKP